MGFSCALLEAVWHSGSALAPSYTPFPALVLNHPASQRGGGGGGGGRSAASWSPWVTTLRPSLQLTFLEARKAMPWATWLEKWSRSRSSNGRPSSLSMSGVGRRVMAAPAHPCPSLPIPQSPFSSASPPPASQYFLTLFREGVI